MNASETTPQMLSIWFLVGLILTIYGVILVGCGVYYSIHPEAIAQFVLGYRNPSLWWGGVMAALGTLFLVFGRR